jgi:hypothetical protein
VAVPALIGGDASFCATLKAYLAGVMPSAALASLWDTLQVCLLLVTLCRVVKSSMHLCTALSL